MPFEFHGTRLTGHGDVHELRAQVRGLRRRGARHAQLLRSSGWFFLVALVAAVTSLVLGEIEAFFVVGLLAIVVAAVRSTLVPELAVDPRLEFLGRFVDTLTLPEHGGLEATVELNAFDCEAPERLENIDGGKLRVRYLQRWLELAFPREQERYRLHIEVDVEQTEDGIERSEQHRKTRVHLSHEGQRSSLIPGPPDLPAGFAREGRGLFVAEDEELTPERLAALVDTLID